jgi:hypothetical protein
MAGVLFLTVSCAREAPAEVQRANQAGDAGQFGGACPLHRDVSIMPARAWHEAREVVTRLKIIIPAVVPSVLHYRNPEHRELLLSGLRMAREDTE